MKTTLTVSNAAAILLPQVAIYGKNFCASAKDAFKLLMRNVLRAAVLDRIVDFVLLMGESLYSV